MSSAAIPLVSLVVISYRQEAFIEAALAGALSQDYAALEIVFSDDASPDGTWDKATAYLERHGAGAKIIARRATTNTGICGNIDEAVRLASGKYVVIAAGDDISLPRRVSETVKVFESDPAIFAVGCDFATMDIAGNPSGHLQGTVSRTPCDAMALAVLGQNVGGAGAAYRREVFERFGPLSRDTVNEDMVLEFRAALLGKVAAVPLPLVRHRIHSASVTGTASAQTSSFAQYEAGARKMAHSILKAYEARLIDLETALRIGCVKPPADEIRNALQRHVAIMRNVVDLHDTRPQAFVAWLTRMARRQTPFVPGMRTLIMAGFPRLWFWHISRREREGRLN
jgi:glycosyltransferase involved in cell wall biosynthesis